TRVLSRTDRKKNPGLALRIRSARRQCSLAPRQGPLPHLWLGCIPGVAAGLREQPLRELAHVRLADGKARFDDEIRPRSHQRLSERRGQRAGFDQIVEQRQAAERYALAADRRLDHLLVLAEVQRRGGPEIAD